MVSRRKEGDTFLFLLSSYFRCCWYRGQIWLKDIVLVTLGRLEIKLTVYVVVAIRQLHCVFFIKNQDIERKAKELRVRTSARRIYRWWRVAVVHLCKFNRVSPCSISFPDSKQRSKSFPAVCVSSQNYKKRREKKNWLTLKTKYVFSNSAMFASRRYMYYSPMGFCVT